MSYDRLPATIPMYNDGYHDENDDENFVSASASASASSSNSVNQHRHRKKSSAAYGYAGYPYSSYTSSRKRVPSLSPVRTNNSHPIFNWLNNIPPIPIPIPRFLRRILRPPVYYLSSSIQNFRSGNSAPPSFPGTNSRRINLRKSPNAASLSPLPRIILILLFLAFATLLYFLSRIWEPHIELAFYSRKFVREEILPVQPLAGCFNHPSWRYNVTERLYGPRYSDVQAGLDMRFGLDCYEFAGTIQSWNSRPSSHQRTQFHTYWRSDLEPFGPRQEYMLKSFFATQNLAASKLILWSNDDLRSNKILKEYLKRYGSTGKEEDDEGSERGSFDVRVADVAALSKGTELDPDYSSDNEPGQQKFLPPIHRLSFYDSKAWLDGDLIRLLLLWNFGGVWVDMDFLLTRDLEPLLEHEFVTQWDCYDKKYSPLNGALMRFHVHSPYLCEAFHIMATGAPPRPHSTDWGSTLYLKLYRRLIKGGVKPFKVLPWCFADGRSCRLDNRLPDPFKEDHKAGIGWWEKQVDDETAERSWWPFRRSKATTDSDVSQTPAQGNIGANTGNPPALARALSQVFGIHLHNQWTKSYPENGWVERLLLRRYEGILTERNRLSVTREVDKEYENGLGMIRQKRSVEGGEPDEEGENNMDG